MGGMLTKASNQARLKHRRVGNHGKYAAVAQDDDVPPPYCETDAQFRSVITKRQLQLKERSRRLSVSLLQRISLQFHSVPRRSHTTASPALSSIESLPTAHDSLLCSNPLLLCLQN